MSTAALGWRSHSGWAALVAVGGSPQSPIVLYREKVELLGEPLPRQPYHAAAENGLSLDEAAELIARVERAATLAARAATESVVAALKRAERRTVGAGLVAASRRIPAGLTGILASHALLHAAEGQLYENALAQGSAGAGLPLITLAPKTIFDDAARELAMNAGDLGTALAATGKLAGPPWQKDHREAAAAALVALAIGRGVER
jgi:hypothetical protein